ncbi:hypothetical protein MMPV_005787 [Pyropia vietnamensis]
MPMAMAFISPAGLFPSRPLHLGGLAPTRRGGAARSPPVPGQWGLPTAAPAVRGLGTTRNCRAAAIFSSPCPPSSSADVTCEAGDPRGAPPVPTPLLAPPLFPVADTRPAASAPTRKTTAPWRRRLGVVASAMVLLGAGASRRAVAASAPVSVTSPAAVSVTVESPTAARVAVKGGRLAPLRTTLHRVMPAEGDKPLVLAAKVATLAVALFSVAFAGMIAVFYGIQDRLVYKPSRESRGTPGDFGMPDFDDVSFCTMDGVEINGWFIRRPGQEYRTARTLVYFHGTDKNASFRLKKAAGFFEKCHCNVLLTSYRGYGSSGGSPNEKGMCRDADGAFEYLRARTDIDGGRLWVFGESLGGAVSLHFVKRYEQFVNALVLENTFTSLLDMINREFPFLGVFRYLSRNQWRSTSRIRSLTLPMLFLSGQRDAYIPPDMMKQLHSLAEASSSYTEFVPISDGTHSRTWTNKNYFTSVSAFMDKVEREGLSHAEPMPRDTLKDSGDVQFA